MINLYKVVLKPLTRFFVVLVERVGGDKCFDTQEKSVLPGGVKNGKFVTLTPFKKIGLNQ